MGGTVVGLCLSSFFSYRELVKRAEAELVVTLNVKAENLEGSLNSFKTSAELTIEAIKTLHEAGEQREQVYVELIRRALEQLPLATGMGFGQPPDSRIILPSRQYAYPYAIKKGGVVTAKGGESNPDSYNEPYFTQPIAAKRGLWLEPVSYLETTLDPPQYVVSTSYAAPFYTKDGKLLGVFSQDLELGFLSEVLSEKVINEAGYFVLVSANGNLIAYPPDPQQALKLNPFPKISNYSELWNKIETDLNSRQASNGLVAWRDASGKRRFWAYRRIANTNWVLLASVPESVVFGPILRFTVGGSLGAILGAAIVLAIVVALFVRNLNRRLQPIMDECNRLAETNAKSEELMSREDELGRLTISFYNLLGQVTVNERRLRKEMARSAQAFQALQQAQAQLIQTEKMSSLGQLVAGIAHEINNPINFIYGNLPHAASYAKDLVGLIQLYEQHYTDPVPEIRAYRDEIDLEFLIEDLEKMLSSMRIGADRIREIVLSLRNFSRLDEAEMKPVNIHDGIDSTLLILQNRLKGSASCPKIDIVKAYGDLPLVDCYPGQLNQVFMNILSNAIDALSQFCDKQQQTSDAKPFTPTITIHTQLIDQGTWVRISFKDNGPGIPAEHLSKLFDPFFTTKPVGEGTGLGLSISYQIIVEKHRGRLTCVSALGEGAEFVIEIPVSRPDVPT
ncbi:MAG: sensor histidine kinase [Cyanobacteria bacterium]|nr:sensor histidine kinase [Cyanobacteriota bacterium]